MIEEIDKLRKEDFLTILDQPTKSRIAELYQPFAEKMFNIYFNMYEKYGMRMRCTEGLRSYEKQQTLYDQGRKVPGKILTNAKPGQSLHNFGLAADSCFVGNDPFLDHSFNGAVMWEAFGNFVKMESLAWGRYIPGIDDLVHVENRYGMALGDLQYLMSQGGLPLIYKEINSYHQEIDSTN